ncbi:hypothetical protein, partial [Klebsiella pneumoniae]|uniref:hypothetical protein n=1 Tax=Klebsiella pneumoniae TaxID=573 RepID=UPI0019D6F593
ALPTGNTSADTAPQQSNTSTVKSTIPITIILPNGPLTSVGDPLIFLPQGYSLSIRQTDKVV